jgi:hypothetical protein
MKKITFLSVVGAAAGALVSLTTLGAPSPAHAQDPAYMSCTNSGMRETRFTPATVTASEPRARGRCSGLAVSRHMARYAVGNVVVWTKYRCGKRAKGADPKVPSAGRTCPTNSV